MNHEYFVLYYSQKLYRRKQEPIDGMRNKELEKEGLVNVESGLVKRRTGRMPTSVDVQ